MIKELHEKLVNKEESCAKITREYLDVIKRTNEKFNSFITVCEKEALKNAQEVDAKIAKGKSIGLLEGIPIAVKDNIVVKGVKTTAGSKILENYISPYDARVIEKIKQAGMIIVGKTNCDSFGHGGGNENSDFGTVHNPWDLDRVPGGSSGGSAVAVASGQCPTALGSDTGGSLRHPACWCGISALKPTYGRVSRNGLIAFASSTDVIGPIARSVEDVTLIFERIAGWDKNDASSVNIPIENYSQSERKDLSGIKIGIPKEYFAEGIDKNVRDAINNAIERIKELGADVGEANLPNTKYAVACYYIIAPSETSTNLSRMDGIRFGKRSKKAKDLFETYAKSKAEGFHQETKRRIILGTFALSHGYYDAYYTKAQKIRELIKDDFKKEFEKFDCLFAPIAPHVAYKIGEHSTDPIKAYLEDMYLSASSLAGIPSLAVPCGFVDVENSDKRLPIGFQLLGNWFGEKKILEIGKVFERINV